MTSLESIVFGEVDRIRMRTSTRLMEYLRGERQ